LPEIAQDEMVTLLDKSVKNTYKTRTYQKSVEVWWKSSTVPQRWL